MNGLMTVEEITALLPTILAGVVAAAVVIYAIKLSIEDNWGRRKRNDFTYRP